MNARVLSFCLLALFSVPTLSNADTCIPYDKHLPVEIQRALQATVTINKVRVIPKTQRAQIPFTIRETGSGFILNEKGYVVGSAHVAIDGAGAIADSEGNVVVAFGKNEFPSTYTITLSDCRTYHAEVVKVGDESNGEPDAALWRIIGPATSLTAATLRTKPLDIGESLFGLGSPLGKHNTVLSGSILGYQETAGGVMVITSDIHIDNGSSGGPLVDNTGAVVGIAQSFVLSHREKIFQESMFIPIGTIMRFLQ